jgi:hypothetical protein
VWKYKERCLAAGWLGLVDEPSKHDDLDCRGSDQVTRVLDSGRLCFPCTWDLRDRTGLSRCPLDGGRAPNIQANSGDCAEEYRHDSPIMGTVSGAWERLPRLAMGIVWGLVWAKPRLLVESAVRHGRSRPSCEPLRATVTGYICRREQLPYETLTDGWHTKTYDSPQRWDVA